MKYNDCKVRVKPGWAEFGKSGVALGEPVFVEQMWLPI